MENVPKEAIIEERIQLGVTWDYYQSECRELCHTDESCKYVINTFKYWQHYTHLLFYRAYELKPVGSKETGYNTHCFTYRVNHKIDKQVTLNKNCTVFDDPSLGVMEKNSFYIYKLYQIKKN